MSTRNYSEQIPESQDLRARLVTVITAEIGSRMLTFFHLANLEEPNPGGRMPAILEVVPHKQEKPHPNSYDSGHEHSLDHWLEVYWLVEEDYVFAKNTDPEPHVNESPLRDTLR